MHWWARACATVHWGWAQRSFMHPYTHANTGITIAMPQWVLEDGVGALMERLRDPETIIDNSTYEDPHQYPTGIRQVFVNGGQVVRNGAPQRFGA